MGSSTTGLPSMSWDQHVPGMGNVDHAPKADQELAGAVQLPEDPRDDLAAVIVPAVAGHPNGLSVDS